MIYKVAVFLAVILAGTALNATQKAQPGASQSPVEVRQTRHAGDERDLMSGTLLVSAPRLSVTLATIEPAAPEMSLTLESFEYDYSEGS
jgi:hypothetical protein